MFDSFAFVATKLARRPWIAVVVCVLVCALFAARAVGHVIEAQMLGDARTAPAIPRIEPAPVVTAAVADPRAQGRGLVDRDMFCSTCGPALPPPGEVVQAEGGEIALTSLPLVLVATSLGHQPIATVRDDRSGSQGAYYVGEALPGAGAITKIGATYVDFVNTATSKEERVSLIAAAAKTAAVTTTTAGPAPAASADNPYADRIKKLDDTRYEVARDLVKELVGAAGKPLPGVRMVPASKDGKLAGIRVLQARPDSIAGQLGLRGGDTLAAVNGIAIDSIDKMLEVYSKLDNMNAVTIDGTRGGKPISWEYKLR
jgi:type II secretory pathway component PulC